MIPDRLFQMMQRQGLFQIDPYDRARQQPVSYDLQLGTHTLRYPARLHGVPLDIGVDVPGMEMGYIPERDDASVSPYYLQPQEFILGETRERLTLGETIAAEFMGKSSLGRVGLFVHVTAGLVDPGWGQNTQRGLRLTVELFNASTRPLRLWAGMDIGQLVVHHLIAPVLHPYGHESLHSHYADGDIVTESKGGHSV